MNGLLDRRRAMQMALLIPAICGDLTSRAMAGEPLADVDPDLRPMAQLILDYPSKWTPSIPPAEQRRFNATVAHPKPAADVPISQIMVPGLKGQPSVRALMFGASTAQRLRPAIIYVHGGGYIFGSPEESAAYVQDLVRRHDCLVISPDYRLAPEMPFPGAREDVYAVLAYLNRDAARLGIDPSRIVIFGGSAGGGLAAQVALAARDRHEFALAGQALLYPMLDDRTGSTRTPAATVGRIGFNAEANRASWTYYLGRPAGSERIPEGAVPSRISNLSGLPPTFVGVGNLDLFLEEDVEFAQRLIVAGVATELITVPGAYHAFDGLVPTAPISRRFNASVQDFIARRLA